MKKAIFFLFVSLSVSVYGQEENDITYFLMAGRNDASKLITAYIHPAITGLSYGFNGGWYSTAKTHKPLGFDLSVTLNGVFVPSEDNLFDPMTLRLENVTAFRSTDPSAKGLAPTIMGPAVDARYFVDVNHDGDIDAEFNGPRGVDFKKNIGISGVAAPTANLSLGIYKNTDLKIRWIPEFTQSATSIKAIGVGVMHDVKQHLPGMTILPFDLSVLVAYTNIKGSTALENTFDKPSNDQRRQEMVYNMDGWLFQALISKKLAIVTFYGGIGFNTAKTSADVKGSYVIDNLQLTMRDPVSLGFNNKSARLSGGVRINLGPVYINGEYVLQKYSMVSAGLGVSIREIKMF